MLGWGEEKKNCQPLFRAQIRPLDRLVSTPEAKHGSSNQRNRSGSVSLFRPRIRLRFGGVNAPNSAIEEVKVMRAASLPCGLFLVMQVV
jgi:hypothetical protein